MEPSILHLKGFFLRLRLRKWEEGLGGTGYYVACITGFNTTHLTVLSLINSGLFTCYNILMLPFLFLVKFPEANSQGAQQNSNRSIVVDVGGMKCSVDSQYISNHDFLEVKTNPT